MEHRSTERRGRVTARLSALTCLAGLVVSTLMVLSPPADAAAGSGGGGQGTGRSCKKEDSGQQSKTKCVGPVGGAMAGIDATNLAEQLLSSVAKSAGSKIGGELAGWALESIFGPTPDPTQQLKEQLDVLQGQMTQLQTQVHLLETQLRDSINKLMTQNEQETFDVAAALVNKDAATLADFQLHLDTWMKRKPGTPVDGTQSSEMDKMRKELGGIIQNVDLSMVGHGSQRGLIAIFRDLLASRTQYPTGRFYTSDFTTPMSDMLDYYESLTVQAFNQLAEVSHVSWTSGGVPFFSENDVVEAYADLVPKMLVHWNQLATKGVGRLPDDVVADTSTGLMWSQSNLTLAGTKVFCWSVCGANLALSTLLTPDTVIDGLTGWAVPSQAQFTQLASGQGQGTFQFLTANGFHWQQTGPTVKVNNVPITAPAYWSAGGTSVDFGVDHALHLHDANYWPFFLPGPGAVAVRPIG